MPSVLLFCEGISHGHLARALVMSQWLQNSSLQLRVVCPAKHASLFHQYRLATLPLSVADPALIYHRLRQGKAMYTREELIAYYREDKELLDEHQPDLVISEFRFTALQLAQQRSIPSVGMTDATCHPHLKILDRLPDPVAKPRFVPLPWLRALSNGPVGRVLEGQFLQQAVAPFQQASQAVGLPTLESFFAYTSQGDLCLLCDDPRLIPIQALRPQDRYTGALLWQRTEPLPEKIIQLQPHIPTVYVALGTQPSLSTNFLPSYVQALLDRGAQVVVSKGNREVAINVRHSRLQVYDFINEGKLMPYIDVIVYPGGAMTTYQALTGQTALLVLPAHGNQHLYAQYIAHQGFGQFLLPSRTTTAKLVARTYQLLEDSALKEKLQQAVWPSQKDAIVREILQLAGADAQPTD